MRAGVLKVLGRFWAHVERVLFAPLVIIPLTLALLAASAYCFYLAYRDYERSQQPPEPVLRAARHWLTTDELLSRWYNAKFTEVTAPNLATALEALSARRCADVPDGGRAVPIAKLLPEARKHFFADLAAMLAALAQNEFAAYRAWCEQTGMTVRKETAENLRLRLKRLDVPFGERDDGWKLLERLWRAERPKFRVRAVAPGVSCVLFWEGTERHAKYAHVAEGSDARHGFGWTHRGVRYVETGIYGHATLEGMEQALFADVVLIAKHGGDWPDAVSPYYIRFYYDALCKHWHPIEMELAPASFRPPENLLFWF